MEAGEHRIAGEVGSTSSAFAAVGEAARTGPRPDAGGARDADVGRLIEIAPRPDVGYVCDFGDEHAEIRRLRRDEEPDLFAPAKRGSGSEPADVPFIAGRLTDAPLTRKHGRARGAARRDPEVIDGMRPRARSVHPGGDAEAPVGAHDVAQRDEAIDVCRALAAVGRREAPSLDEVSLIELELGDAPASRAREGRVDPTREPARRGGIRGSVA